ncbi:MAG: lysophospholipid acyltransferase family protein [Deltaproteobacteria bacterium]|nr:lysophospholipid acyltransferase family protein [Deltaproteobacteria bacterium]
MRLLVLWIGLWPERWALAYGELLGRLVHALGIRRRVALENLAQAFPEKSDAEREAICAAHYAHLGRSAIEFFRSVKWSNEELLARVEANEWDIVERTRAEQKGLIACVAHLGNFEVFAGYIARRGLPLTAVTRQLKGSANDAWMSVRGELGVRELRGKNVVAKMIDVLREEGVLALIIDQNMLPKRAIFSPLFGRLAATTPAPAVLAERTGAPVILAALFRLPDGRFRTRFMGPFGLRGSGSERTQALTDDLNRALETMIREHPEQWFWVHRRWKTRPPNEAAQAVPAP